ncbi:MAG: aminodeoxychorismate/anthranilate synthase component II [Flavobacteriia bacterium]|nr:aminodeoxychorismate/anthranilate synthase component II [Flavobacteriia bacterium]
MRILIIDNYDSFTFNLKHDLERIDEVEVDVVRNDVLDFNSFSDYDRIVLSPGPGLPEESGQLMEAIHRLKDMQIPVLGVCLGLQALVQYTGGKLYNLGTVRHGISFPSKVDVNDSLYRDLSENQKFGMYHSWAAQKPLNDEWRISAESEEGIIMSIRHIDLPWVAVQYHPESVLSPNGRLILKNWIERA